MPEPSPLSHRTVECDLLFSHDTLCSLCYGYFRKLPEEWLATRVLKALPDADWPMRRDAVLELARWFSDVRQFKAKIEPRHSADDPARVLVHLNQRGQPPAETRLWSIDPFHGACSCREYLTGELGLCRHLLLAVESAFKSGCHPRHSIPTWRWNPCRLCDESVGMNGDRPCDSPLERIVVHAEEPLLARSRLLKCHFIVDRDRAAPEWLRFRFHLGMTGPCRVVTTLRDHLSSLPPSEVDPALRNELERFLPAQAAAECLDQHRESLLAAAAQLRTQLYPYQRQGVERFFERGRLLLGDEMGLGKTVQAIAICHALWTRGRVDRILIVAPASLKTQWCREYRRFADDPIEIVAGQRPLRRGYYRRERAILVTNYESLWYDIDDAEAWRPQLVIADEAQRFKNAGTLTARTMARFEAPYRLAMTGTPLENRVSELGSILCWLDAHRFGPAWRTAARHTWMSDATGADDEPARGLQRLDELRARLDPLFLRRTRDAVLDDLPERRDHTESVPMDDAQLAAHHDFVRKIRILMEAAEKRALSYTEERLLVCYLTEMRIVANGMAQYWFEDVWPDIAKRCATDRLIRELSSPKLGCLRTLVGRILEQRERRIVIFSGWRRMLQLTEWALRPVLDASDVRALFFTGKESLRKRLDNLVAFHECPRTRVLLSTDAGGVGLNLQRASDCMVQLELPWNPAVFEQRVGRIHRIGQQRRIDVHRIVTAGSIEDAIALGLSGKRKTFDAIFDGDADHVEIPGNSLRRIVALFNEGKDGKPSAMGGVESGGMAIDEPNKE